MDFNFLDDEQETEDEEFLDLSEIPTHKKKAKKARTSKHKRVVASKEHSVKKAKDKDREFSFEDIIPEPKQITDKDVQTKAQQGRQRSVSNMSYENKREEGWSLYCAHKKHLPTLCERAQDNAEVTCTCSCHPARLYVRQESKYIPGSDDDEVLLLTG